MQQMPISVSRGSPLPLGASRLEEGVNFAVFSRHGSAVWLLLFGDSACAELMQRVELDRAVNRTGDIWHICIQSSGEDIFYAWQVDGPNEPGHCFDRHRVLLDPYARALAGTVYWDFSCGCKSGESQNNLLTLRPRCLLVSRSFDWQGDVPPAHPWSDTVIYETHVRGLTMHPSSAASHPGCFSAVAEKSEYLKALGVTAVELMPVQEFFEHELTRKNPLTGECLRNYWGYSTVSFFAPKEGYGSRRDPGCQVDEFKQMVRSLHGDGIEVILDMVFNHTAEGNHIGPVINFRGLDNSIYYMLEEDRHFYRNYSGTGNTLNCNHPVVRDYILDCLRYWVIEMHVDGFRFDLASVLGRDEQGTLLVNPPLLERIAEDPVLSGVKLIAEAWDAGGAYQVGHFPGLRWSEWNGQFRDDVRRFWRGDAGMTGKLASRLSGSSDIYQGSGKSPLHSINYITCHDGFTLNDLVSYDNKHNYANGEGNNDGCNDNYSCNYGVEGPTDAPAIDALRLRQSKNMLATLFFSRGVPMLLGGDEFRRTQYGNNNAYCQDNETSWYDWQLLQHNQELYEFVSTLIKLRKQFRVLSSEHFYKPDEIHWFGPDLKEPDWQGPDGLLGCMLPCATLEGTMAERSLCLLLNASLLSVDFQLPELASGEGWQLLLDTAVSGVLNTDPAFLQKHCLLQARAVTLLVAHA